MSCFTFHFLPLSSSRLFSCSPVFHSLINPRILKPVLFFSLTHFPNISPVSPVSLMFPPVCPGLSLFFLVCTSFRFCIFVVLSSFFFSFSFAPACSFRFCCLWLFCTWSLYFVLTGIWFTALIKKKLFFFVLYPACLLCVLHLGPRYFCYT